MQSVFGSGDDTGVNWLLEALAKEQAGEQDHQNSDVEYRARDKKREDKKKAKSGRSGSKVSRFN